MEYIERLKKSLSDLENNAEKLANLPELVRCIKETISLCQEANESVNQSGKELKEIENQLTNRLEELQKVLKIEQESKDELMNNIKSVLIASKKEQLDALDAITIVVGNKIAIVESNLSVKATELDSGVKKIELKVIENESKLVGIATDIVAVGEKLKSIIPTIKRIQIITIIGSLLALAACVLNFIV